MLLKTVRLMFNYTERALTPKTFSHLLQTSPIMTPQAAIKLNQNLGASSVPSQSQSLSEIMHSLYLYQSNIAIFDYDYYQKICHRLIDFQKKMTMAEILTVLKLGIKHNVKNQALWQHFQAQIHNRLHRSIYPVFELEKKQYQINMTNFIQNLEKQRTDHFNILTPQFIEEQKKQQQPSQPKQQIQYQIPNSTKTSSSRQLAKKQKKQSPTQFSYDLVQILIWYGSQNTRLINLLLQTQVHPKVLLQTPEATLRYAQLLVYACQLNMKTYQSNKNNYTARSIKNIYKFQGAYFPELVKNLKACLGNFDQQQIKHLTAVVGGFPLKKRAHRKTLTELIVNQWKNRGIPIDENEKVKIQEILGKDQKLVKKFNESIGQTQTQKVHLEKQQQINHIQDKNKQINTKL